MHAAPRALQAPAPLTIAFITDEIPRPNRAGYLAYSHALLSRLAARGHAVRIVLARPRLAGMLDRFDDAFDPGRVSVAGPGIAARGGRVVSLRPRSALRGILRSVVARLPASLGEAMRRRDLALRYGGADAVMGRLITRAEAITAARHAAGCDLVIADAVFRAPALAHLGPGPRRAIITHDVFHLRHAALSARGMKLHPARFSVEEETALLAHAGLLVAIQPEEAALLGRMAPAAQVVTAPMPAQPVPRPADVAREPGRIVFVGSIAPHNVDGMRWFATEVWPLVRARLPGARLDVIGTVGRGLAGMPEGIVLHGMVPDLAPLLHRASVAIAPMRAGSGLNIKMLDFAAHGLATVSTSLGAAALAHTADWPFEVADTAPDFAAATARLAAEGAAAREAAAAIYLRNYEAGHMLAPFLAAIERPG